MYKKLFVFIRTNNAKLYLIVKIKNNDAIRKDCVNLRKCGLFCND